MVFVFLPSTSRYATNDSSQALSNSLLAAFPTKRYAVRATERVFNLLKPTGYAIHLRDLTFNNCTLCPNCIYVFRIYLKTNSNLCHLYHKLLGFCNRVEKCLQRGTNWIFK